MFSDHLRKVNSGGNGLAGKLLLAAGGLVIVGQLGAVAMVADGQMKKAEQRASRAIAEQVAVQHCLETIVGASRHSCLQQARGEGDGGFAVTASLETGSSGSGNLFYSDASSGPDAMRSGTPMLVPVNFMAH